VSGASISWVVLLMPCDLRVETPKVGHFARGL
jgi:hypothetical protein